MSQDRWSARDIPDQTGRVAIVTGSNSGIGFETARALAEKNAKVVMACRNLEKADAAGQEIKGQEPAAEIEVMRLDLADLGSVRKFVADFRSQHTRLDLLINNAGIMNPPYGTTAQGFETQFGVNHLGHFALTGELLDLLDATPDARIVTVASLMHVAGAIRFDDLNWESGYKPAPAYGQSKLANLLFTYELQRRLDDRGSSTIAVASHPGWTATNLQAYSPMMKFFNRFMAQGTAMGALPTLYAATAPEVRGGQYFGPNGLMEMRGHPKRVGSNKRSRDEEVAARLWTVSEELTGTTYQLT